jgi:hypothetical protein
MVHSFNWPLMTKRVAISQSNYVPWIGYFDLISSVDEFVFYDEVQYTRRDWRNRNRIVVSGDVHYLTLPILNRGRYHQKISEAEFSHPCALQRHWKTLSQSYRKAPYFDEISDLLEPIYLGGYTRLSALNVDLVTAVCRYLDIRTTLRQSSEFELPPGRSERLLSICEQLQATAYVSGPASQAYLDVPLFTEHGISCSFFDYGPYPAYPQFCRPYQSGLSILDVLFHCGAEARHHLIHSKDSSALTPRTHTIR